MNNRSIAVSSDAASKVASIRLTRRAKLMGTIVGVHVTIFVLGAYMFYGTHAYTLKALFVTLAFGAVIGPIGSWFAARTHKILFKRLHSLLNHESSEKLTAGELARARWSVIAIPWVCAGRDICLWLMAAPLHYRCLQIFHCEPLNSQNWYSSVLPLLPLVGMSGLIAYSAAMQPYRKYFFNRGEYSDYTLALTNDKLKVTSGMLLAYGVLLFVLGIQHSLEHRSNNVHELVESVKSAEVFGALLIGVTGIGFFGLRKLLGERDDIATSNASSSDVTQAPTTIHCPQCDLALGDGMTVCPNDGTPVQFPPSESALSTNYEFLEQIARGGMSVIYKARHRWVKRIVAVKMLDAESRHDVHSIRRFRREAEAASRLQHPNIVSVFDFGILDGRKCYLVMDYLNGLSLSDLIAKQPQLPVKQSLKFFMEVCDALAYAHDERVLHRDLKPTNIMVVGQGAEMSAKLVDFGIAKFMGETASHLTRTGDVCGTPGYMSPEQCLGQQLDQRTDIYSFGCVMYEVLTGKRPFSGENPLHTMYLHLNEQPSHIYEVRRDLPAAKELDAIVFKALAKEPDKRFNSMREIKSALEKIASTL